MIRPKTKLELEIEAQKKRGILLVLSGASAGVGKDAVRKGLLKKYHFEQTVTCVSRSKRVGERDGFDHHFLTKQEFEKRIKENFFLENVLYLGNHYGTPKKDVIGKIKKGKDVLLRVDVRGAKSVKKAIPQAVLVYIAPPSFETLEKRLHKRKDKEELIKKKLQVAIWEIEQFEGFDYVVVNEEGKLDKTVELVKSIVETERRKIRNNK